MTTATKQTAQDVVTEQMATIYAAIAQLQQAIDTVADTTDADSVTWRDVARLAKAADVSRTVLESFGQ